MYVNCPIRAKLGGSGQFYVVSAIYFFKQKMSHRDPWAYKNACIFHACLLRQNAFNVEEEEEIKTVQTFITISNTV